MNLPSYPGQPQQPQQPEQPGQPGQPTPPAQPPAPPTPPTQPPTPPAGPPAPPQPPAYPGAAGGATPPPPPPAGGALPPPGGGFQPPGGGFPPPAQPYLPYAGPNDGGAGYSGVAIAAFVCALTCCAAPVAIVLGIIGIIKTGAGKARGRWMAVTGLVLGVIGSLVLLALALGFFALSGRVIGPDNAEVGQCVQVDTNGDKVTMFDTGCSMEHNGQIFAVLTPAKADEAAGRTTIELCATRIAGAFPGATPSLVDGEARLDLGGEQVEVASASETGDLAAGSPVACWIEAVDGVLEDDHVD